MGRMWYFLFGCQEYCLVHIVFCFPFFALFSYPYKLHSRAFVQFLTFPNRYKKLRQLGQNLC